MTTPWGLISAQYDLYTTGRKLLGAGKAGATACGKAGSGSGGDILAHASRKLLQDSPSVPQNGAAAPGLSLPANSSMPTDVDADLTQGKQRRTAFPAFGERETTGSQGALALTCMPSCCLPVLRAVQASL